MFNSRHLVAAIDAHIVDGTVRSNHAAEAEIRRLIGTVAKCAIGTRAIRPVAVVGITTAASETTNRQHAVATRTDPGHADDATGRVGAEKDAENSADARAVIETALDRRGALLRRDAAIRIAI